MDADFLGESAGPWHSRRNETCVTAVKEKWRKDSRSIILNAIGLIAFPWVGSRLGLTQTQFGLWAALAIHDTSSVVGAGRKYG